MCHVGHLRQPLLVGGVGDDGGVAQEEQLGATRQLRRCHVGEHLALGQQSALLVEHCPQQGGGVQHTLHHGVGLAAASQGHGLCGGGFVRGGGDEVHVSTVVLGHAGQLAHGLYIAHKDGFGKTVLYCLHGGSRRTGIAAAHNGYTAALLALRQVCGQGFETMDGWHKV